VKLLVVEDEARLAQLMARGLGEEGHQVTVAATAAEAAAQLAGGEPDWDCVILDWGLPDGDGLALLGRWRRRGVTTPVLMLTARGEVGERVTGLRTGADDYLVKPFDFEELLARIEALGRRAGGGGEVVRAGSLAVHTRSRELVCGDRRVALTGRELEVLLVLARRAGDLVTRAELLAGVWGAEFDGPPNVVDVYIGYLRGKLRELDAEATIATVRGLGYRLEAAGGRR
jgi:DNA-binding response OmpR family regulator